MTESTALANHYDLNAVTYEERVLPRAHYGERLHSFLRQHAVSGKRVLDVGCGPGHFTANLDPGVNVTFADLSANMLAVATEKRPGSASLVHDFHDEFPVRGFDVVLAVACLEFCRDLPRVMRNLASTMADGAHAFVTIVERRNGMPSHDAPRVAVAPAEANVPAMHLYTLAEMVAAIDAAKLSPRSYEHMPGWFSKFLDRDVWYGAWVLAK